MTKYEFIKSTTSIPEHKIKICVDLLEDGNTIPFIARYRKDRTGNLDEIMIKDISDNLKEYSNIVDRKRTILNTLTELDELTDDLHRIIETTWDKKRLEDIYAPFKPKRSTRATRAIKSGLKPLARKILKSRKSFDLQAEAKKFISPDKKVRTIQDAIAGACDIISMYFAEDIKVKEKAGELSEKGRISIKKRRGVEDTPNKYIEYYDREETVKHIPSHRVLAILRGEKEKFLSISLQMDEERLRYFIGKVFYVDSMFCKELLLDTIQDSLKRLILPSVQNEILNDLKEAADKRAIKIFSKNLESLLLSSPLGEKTVLAVDPGLRTGAKIVVISDIGKYVEGDAVYFKNDSQVEKDKVKKMIINNNVEYIALGNGTGDREVRAFLNKVMDENGIKIPIISVNESGASVYSASKLAQEEFPTLDLTLRGAISIGRRLQDPLSELVKIDPKSIGVGQYQHDVNQTLLKEELEYVVKSCVNKVGVNLNTAGEYILKFVSGLNSKSARNIVKEREQKGQYINREEILKVPGIGKKTFEQCAGFLRIKGQDPIENTGIHPESYFVVEKISEKLNVDIDDIIRNEGSIKKIKKEELYSEQIGKYLLEDILNELKKPGLDPRDDFEQLIFDPNIDSIEKLKEGQILSGKITNITGFGAFCDIGVHQDGLIHISQITDSYIKDVNDVLTTGQSVKVKVVEVDDTRKRISLSLKDVSQNT